MLKKVVVIPLLLLLYNGFGQDNLSIIKNYCLCTPRTFTEQSVNNKISFITDEGELRLITIEKIGNQWVKTLDKLIKEYYGYILEEEGHQYDSIIKINNKLYFYSVLVTNPGGTAYNGFTNIYFIFNNLESNDDVVVFNYERWYSSFTGEYILENEKNINDYIDFIKIANESIDYFFGVANEDIEDESNFDRKWTSLNKNIYRDLDDGYFNSYTINITEYKGVGLYETIKSYNVNTENEIITSKYKASAGFNCPTVVYNKNSDITSIVFIPEGWPNGGGWGFRSFYVKSLVGDVITIASSDYEYKINLKTKQLSWKYIAD